VLPAPNADETLVTPPLSLYRVSGFRDRSATPLLAAFANLNAYSAGDAELNAILAHSLHLFLLYTKVLVNNLVVAWHAHWPHVRWGFECAFVMGALLGLETRRNALVMLTRHVYRRQPNAQGRLEEKDGYAAELFPTNRQLRLNNLRLPLLIDFKCQFWFEATSSRR